MRVWLEQIRLGDWLCIACLSSCVVASYAWLWQPGSANKAVIRLDGRVVAELPLSKPGRYRVSGPLGATEIEVQPGRARVISDPGPRQYCVHQGWLSRPNAVAICAPNHVSLALGGRLYSHDSLSY